jgi:hypothetical protein
MLNVLLPTVCLWATLRQLMVSSLTWTLRGIGTKMLGRKMKPVRTDPEDLTGMTDADVLTYLMKAYHLQKELQRIAKLSEAATARNNVERYYEEARHRMARSDPVLRGTRG